jgi:hypothetical protein
MKEAADNVFQVIMAFRNLSMSMIFLIQKKEIETTIWHFILGKTNVYKYVFGT